MASAKEEIIRDILRLYTTYGANEIAAALNAIRSGEALSNLLDVIEEVASRRTKFAAKNRPRSSGGKARHVSPRSKEPLDRLIDTLAQSNESEYKKLAIILGAARRGEILPSSVAVRRLMTTLGIQIRPSRDRLSLLRDVGEHLSKVTPADLTPALNEFEQAMRPDSSLQGWADIILRKERR